MDEDYKECTALLRDLEVSSPECQEDYIHLEPGQSGIEICFECCTSTKVHEPPRLLLQTDIVRSRLIVVSIRQITEEESRQLDLPKQSDDHVSFECKDQNFQKLLNILDILFERLIKLFESAPIRFQVVTHWKDLNDPIEMMANSQCLMILRGGDKNGVLWQEDIIIMKTDQQYIKKFCTQFIQSIL
jgi:hypothetical protein